MSNENQHIENALNRLTQLGEMILKKSEPDAFDDFAARNTRPLVEDTLQHEATGGLGPPVADMLVRRESTGELGNTPAPEYPTHRHEKKRHRNDETIRNIIQLYSQNRNVVKFDEQKEDT